MMYKGFEQIRPRGAVKTTEPAITPGVDSSRLENIIAANTEAIKGLADSLKAQPLVKHQTAFSKYPTIDLTTAHTDLAITVVRPVDFIQIWCDGALDGISLKIGSQSAQSIDFRHVNTIRVTDNPETIYFTNDLRPGRSQAIIYFVGGDYPLTLTLGGQPISNAELAVRTGSIHSFDRRGDILFQDDFENNLSKWVLYPAAAAYAGISLSTNFVRMGNSSCRIATGPLGADDSYIQTQFPYLNLNSHGIEVAFTSHSGMIDIYVDFYDGTTLRSIAARAFPITPSTRFRAAAWVEISTDDIYNIANSYNVVKLVADVANSKYKRLQVNNKMFDLSNYPIYSTPSALSPRCLIKILLNTNGVGTQQVSHIDNVILTQNEP